ncbi:ABC transporter substrate-binding protein [Sinosporangium siamense]|uniref:Peptide ABC transporter substrate-binding protein n=1 Tax=Sinosporangium siamense TaxID=1367973 RepID=A0A919V541_9ACTN|nr:ABC transporter substrate-binding protein [Sinosporangium siamense]GII90421.1 peptide ABC transporter substrate-binding protein [Sinosporangium siamense]
MNKTGAVATLGVLGMLAAACGSSPSASGGKPGGAPAENATFTFAISADPGSLDPAMAVDGATRATVNVAYDTLVSITPDGKTVSNLAEKWDVKPTEVTFTLRKGITCSDGSPLTASEVAANFTQITDPASKSPLRGVLVPPDMKAEGDDAAGTVTLSMPKAYSFILENARDVFIVCGKGMKDRSILAKQTSGTGPYVLSDMVAGDTYNFTRREGYTWGPGGATNSEPGQPAKIVARVVTNEQTAANMLLSGQLNLGMFSGTDRARLEAHPSISKRVIPFVNADVIFHQAKGRVGADPAVRKALLQGLNLDELAQVSSSKTGQPAKVMPMQPTPCAGDNVAGNRPAFDAAAADAALTAAGWKPGPDGIRVKDGKRLTLDFIYTNSLGPGAQAAAEYVADAWKKVGVETKLNGLTAAKLWDTLDRTGTWDVVWNTIGVALPSQLVGFYSGPSAPKGANFSKVDNKEYTDLTNQAMKLTGAPACELWNKAEAALIKNADVTPVVELTMLVASKDATADLFGTLVMSHSIRMTKK